jgi:spermidine/putrescine transport system ATP-binding protein
MNHGRIEDQGPAERVYGKPATRFAATFIGESTIVPGHVEANGQIRTPLGLFNATGEVPGTDVFVAVRPEHVSLGRDIRATVKDVVYQGSFKRVTAILDQSPHIRLLARLPADAAVTIDGSISLSVSPDKLIILKD